MPVVMYNGIPYQREQLDPDELETVTMQKILETTSLYQRAVYLVRAHTDTHTLIYSHSQLKYFCADTLQTVSLFDGEILCTYRMEKNVFPFNSVLILHLLK